MASRTTAENLILGTGVLTSAGDNVSINGHALTRFSVTGSAPLAAASISGQGCAFVTLSGGNVVLVSGFYPPLAYACSDETTAVTAATGKLSFRMPHALRFTGFHFDSNVPVSGSSFILDMNHAGTSVFSTRPTIDAGETSTLTAATPCVIASGFLPDGGRMTVDFDQVGATQAGCGIKIALYGIPA
jgi:uncharacterized protein (AIM24 family)